MVYDRERTEEELEELLHQLFDGSVHFDQIMHWVKKQVGQAYTRGYVDGETIRQRITESILKA